MLLEVQLHGCGPRKTQTPLILGVLGLAPSEGGENNHGGGCARSVLVDLAPCGGISPTQRSPCFGQSFRQRQGKFSTFLGRKHKTPFSKDSWWVLLALEGKRVAPTLKGFTDGCFPPSLVCKIISLLGKHSQEPPWGWGKDTERGKTPQLHRSPQWPQFLPGSQNASLSPVLVG